MMKYIIILLFLMITGCQCNSKRGSEKNLPNEVETYEGGKEKKPQRSAEPKANVYGSDKGSLQDTAAEAPIHH
jgi:hypothetical protein